METAKQARKTVTHKELEVHQIYIDANKYLKEAIQLIQSLFSGNGSVLFGIFFR